LFAAKRITIATFIDITNVLITCPLVLRTVQMSNKKNKGPRSPAIDYLAAAIPAAVYNIVFGTLETLNNIAHVSLLKSHPKNNF